MYINGFPDLSIVQSTLGRDSLKHILRKIVYDVHGVIMHMGLCHVVHAKI